MQFDFFSKQSSPYIKNWFVKFVTPKLKWYNVVLYIITEVHLYAPVLIKMACPSPTSDAFGTFPNL